MANTIRFFILRVLVSSAIAAPVVTMLTLYLYGDLGDAWSRGWWLILPPLFVGIVIVLAMAAYEVIRDE